MVGGRAGLPRHGGSVGDAFCGRKDAVMVERRQRHGVNGDLVVRSIDRNRRAATSDDPQRFLADLRARARPGYDAGRSFPTHAGVFQKCSKVRKVLSNTPPGVVQACTKTVSKMSNENAKTLCVRRNASAVAIVILKSRTAIWRSTFSRAKSGAQSKKLSAGFKIICTATDKLKKCATFASIIRKKLPSAKSSCACFW